MPPAGRHLGLADKHFQAARAMATNSVTRNWAAVALFYAARDVAHGVFALEPGLHEPFRHPTNHANVDHNDPGTNFVIRRHFSGIRPPYEDLYANSRGVRYEGLDVDEKLMNELMADFQAVCAWGHERMSSAGRTYFPAWLPDPLGG